MTSRGRKKGAATEIEVLIYIILMLFFLGIFLTLVSKSTEKNIAMNADALELSKLSNTFDLMKRSLYTTWYVSTVQALFTAGFEGMGCGFDSDMMRQGYWYEGSNSIADTSKSVIFPVLFPSRAKVGEAFSIETYGINSGADPVYARLSCNLVKAETEVSLEPSDCTEIRPGGLQKLILMHTRNEKETYLLSCKIDKYSDAGCQTLLQAGEQTNVPGQIEIADDTEYAAERKYMPGGVQKLCVPDRILAAHFLNRTFASYKYIERTRDAGGIGIRIGDDPHPEDNTDIISNFLVSDSGIENRVSHNIALSSPSSSLQTGLTHDIRLATKFSDMLQSAAEAAGFLAIMRQKTLDVEEDYVYLPFLTQKDPDTDEISITSAGDNATDYMQRIYDKIVQFQPKDTIEVDVSKNDMKLVAMPNQRGIALYYDIDMIFSDKGRKPGPPIESGLERTDGIFGWSWPTDSTRVTSCFDEVRSSEKGKRLHKGLDIGSKEPGNAGFVDEVRAGGNPDDTDFKVVVEETNANCPLDNAECGGRYGNFVRLKHEKGDVAYYSLYAHLAVVDVSEGQEIRPGIRIGTMGSTGSSTAKHLHFEIIDKDGGKLDPCEFVDCAQSTLDVCDVEARLDLDQTIITREIESRYYFYDEEANTFEKMPFQLHIKAEDYIPAIDCQKWSGAQLFRLEDKYNVGCFPEPAAEVSYLKLYTCGETKDIEGLAPESMKNEGERIKIAEAANLNVILYAVCSDGSWNILTETGT